MAFDKKTMRNLASSALSNSALSAMTGAIAGTVSGIQAEKAGDEQDGGKGRSRGAALSGAIAGALGSMSVAIDQSFEKLRLFSMTGTSQVELPMFEVIVLATMSAGKSTLINALLGQDLLPSRNEACTARVFKIEDHDDISCFEARITSDAQEFASVPVDAVQLAILNDSADEGVIEIKGNIPGIKNHGARLVIYDTPGPNNSRDDSHRFLTQELLHDKLDGCILYVMNASQFGVNDDALLLSQLKKLKDSSENHKEIIFVLNKVDVLDPEVDSTLVATVNQVQEYLDRNGFTEPTIIPLSAVTALLTRKMSRDDELTRRERGLLACYAEQANLYPDYTESSCVLPATVRQSVMTRYAQKSSETSQVDKSLDNLIRFSGIRILEVLIEDFLISRFSVQSVKEPQDEVTPTDDIETVQNSYSTESSVSSLAKVEHFVEPTEETQQSLMDMSMQSITLSYNPFTVKSNIEIDGKLVQKGSIVGLCYAKRLQLWIDKFFPEVFETLNCEELSFIFQGTDLDSIDVKDAIAKFGRKYPNFRIHAEYKTTPINVDERLRKLIGLLHDAQNGPFEELKGLEISQALEKATTDGFEVNVIATMSAGKSTLINAMLGLELMPAKNEACTATIAKISDHDDMDHFELRRFSRTNELLNNWTRPADVQLAAKLLDTWNSESDTSLIEIKGNIPAIKEREGVKIVLVDTPGPNNSRDSEHLAVTYRAINEQQPSMVLYVLNATQLSTNDDLGLLKAIKEAMAKGGREAQDRFIFIANKIDNFDTENGESIVKAIENVKSYLKDNGIENPLVIPASAELTKLIRINRFYEGEGLTRKQKGSLDLGVDAFCHEPEKDLVELTKADIDDATYQILRNQIDTYRAAKDFHSAAEVLSGIPIVESLLNNYIAKHAIPAKIKDVFDSLKAAEASQKAIAKFNQIISLSDNELGAITRAIDNFQKSEVRIKEADGFRARVQALKYEMSAEAHANRKVIDRKIQLLSDALQDSMVGDCSPNEASNLVNDARSQIIALSTQIEALLAEDLAREMQANIENLQSDYKKFAEDLLEKSFPQDKLNNICREFQSINFEMPDSGQMLKKSTYEDTIRVKVDTKRYGFLWLKKRDIFQDKQIELVNLREIADEMLKVLKKASMENFKQFTIDGEKNLEIAKKCIIEQMNEIDARLEGTLQQLAKALGDKTLKEKQIAENQQKIEWFNQFNKQLNSILDV